MEINQLPIGGHLKIGYHKAIESIKKEILSLVFQSFDNYGEPINNRLDGLPEANDEKAVMARQIQIPEFMVFLASLIKNTTNPPKIEFLMKYLLDDLGVVDDFDPTVSTAIRLALNAGEGLGTFATFDLHVLQHLLDENNKGS